MPTEKVVCKYINNYDYNLS